MSGRLIGVGVGPGDPQLITRRAAKLIEEAPVIAYPAPERGDSMARAIASELIAPDAQEIAIRIPMREERFPAQDIYAEAGRRIAPHLDAGQDVVTLCQGDPFLYGSFMYLFGQLAEHYPTEIIPGVSSINACAAIAAKPVCARLEPLTIVPGPLPDRRIAAALSGGGGCIIMKVGRHLLRLKRLLERLALAERAVLVSHATLPDQQVIPISEAPDHAPYFSIILVPSADPYASG